MFVEVLDAAGVVLAAGCVCSLCHRLAPMNACDVIDLGQEDPGLPVCAACVSDHDYYSSPEHYELADWELWPGDVADVAEVA